MGLSDWLWGSLCVYLLRLRMTIGWIGLACVVDWGLG